MRDLSPNLSVFSSAVLALLSASCAAPHHTSQMVKKAPRVMHEWYDDGGPDRVSIQISLKDQIAEFKRGDREIGWCYVATGKEGHGTSDGTYKITEKIEDKYSNRYGWIEDEFGNVVDGDARYNDKVPEGMAYVPAPMPHWMRLTSYGIGMHGGLIPDPGKPASHGCIRLPKEFVPILFDAVMVGTTVTITHAPSTQGPKSEGLYMPSPHELPRQRPGGDYREIESRPATESDFRRSPRPLRTPLSDPFEVY
ncbi:MAG: L,D-transpeptidase [Akkermansiaceae bacterium]